MTSTQLRFLQRMIALTQIVSRRPRTRLFSFSQREFHIALDLKMGSSVPFLRKAMGTHARILQIDYFEHTLLKGKAQLYISPHPEPE